MIDARSTDPALIQGTRTGGAHGGSVSLSGVTITTTNSSGQHDSGGKHSSGETSRMKRRQSDRLSTVKKRTLAVVIIADIILLTALAYQMIWLNESLQNAFDDKIRDLMGFYTFRYQEQFTHLSFGATLYTRNASDSIACRSISGDPAAQQEVQRRLGNDARGRSLEIAIVTDTAGIIVGSGGRRAALGHAFNPQNIVTDFFTLYPQTADQLQASILIRSEQFAVLGSQQYGVNGDYRTELASWANMNEVLTRVVLTPLQCGTSSAQGYLIWGDAWTPRKYTLMNRLVRDTSSSMIAILARTSDSGWQQSYSYNKAGTTGWPTQFPDMRPYFASDFLHQVYAEGAVHTGQMEFGDVRYRYGTMPLQKQRLGAQPIPTIGATESVILYAEPEHPVQYTVGIALLWHVPFGVFMVLLSIITVFYTFSKFIHPMKLLIESVKKKKLKEFNERIRKLKQNRSTLWTLISKTLLIQGALLGLIFVNRQLLSSSIQDFTSATTQGRVGPFVAATRTRSILACMNGWTGFESVRNALVSGNVSANFRVELAQRYASFAVDSIYVLTPDSVILASSYMPAEGLVFPDVGLMEYFLNGTNDQMTPFTTLTSWHPTNVNRFTPAHFTLADPPAFMRLIVTPVQLNAFNTTDETFHKGDVVGAVVAVRIFNGYYPFWNPVMDTFGAGYYGLFQWDRYHMNFKAVTSVLKTKDGLQYGVDIAGQYPDMLETGILTSYRYDSVYVHEGVDIMGQSDTASVAPYFSPGDDVVLSPLVMNAYQVTAVPQDRYNDMLVRQMVIQSSIMAVEFLTSMLALACTYWPMKTFLDHLEKAFNVPSLSHDKQKKMEERAAAMMDKTRPETVVTEQKRPSGTNLSLQQSSRRSAG